MIYGIVTTMTLAAVIFVGSFFAERIEGWFRGPASSPSEDPGPNSRVRVDLHVHSDTTALGQARAVSRASEQKFHS